VRPLRGYYWLVRTTISSRWWTLRYDARTAWRFLRYATLALRGRVVVLDERTITSRDGMAVIRLTIVPLPLPAAPPDARVQAVAAHGHARAGLRQGEAGDTAQVAGAAKARAHHILW